MKPRSAPDRRATTPSSSQREKVVAALGELSLVLGEIAAKVDEKCCKRCPYMNVSRECTAGFFCVNQVQHPQRTLPLCSGQHKINYSKPGD